MRLAAGLDLSDVQLAVNSSPTWYVALAPVILGGSRGKTVEKKKQEQDS